MTVFISYARANQSAAAQLHQDVERCHRDVWLDRELTGGQSWWRAILQHIRECDVFIVALSPEWVQSTACDLELRYAIALGRPVLPVMVTKTDPRLAPAAVVDAQILDYRQRSPETIFALRDALDALPKAPPLPSPLPAEPAAPISYLNDIVVMLNAPSLSPNAQYDLWQRLKVVLDEAEGDEQVGLLTLVRRLRKRRDLVPALRPLLDAVLAGPQFVGGGGPPTWPTQPYPPITGAETTRQLRPVPPPNPPPPRRTRRTLVWVAAALAALLVPLAIWMGVSLAKPDSGSGPAPSTTPSPTETLPTQETTTGRDPTPPKPPTTKPRPTDPAIAVPNLVGKRVEDADRQLHGLPHWEGEIVHTPVAVTSEDKHGVVVDQRPKSGTITKHSSVTLMVGHFEDPGPSTTPPGSG